MIDRPASTFVRLVTAGILLAVSSGCRLTATPTVPSSPAPLAFATPSVSEKIRPYVPSSAPTEIVSDPLPTKPRDARPYVPLRYSVELWEILLPRDSVTADEAFWKRVDEPVGPDGQQLLRNGVRVGQIPVADLETVRKLIEDRGGKHTTYNGVNGRLVEIPLRDNVPEQIVFHYNRAGELLGRSWEKCTNLFYFSFETTPRNPDRLRVSLTPAVRSTERRLQYATVPGRAERDVTFATEESQYDVTVAADISLDRMLLIGPSGEARQPHTIGGTFLMNEAQSQKQERLILLIPHAFTVGDTALHP